LTGERVVRRLAAILAADVVGYSRLMGRDENGTLTRLKAHRTERLEPTLARHGGRLVKLTGDGALVEFPSAVDALNAAIAFQQAVTEANRDQPEDTRIVFRIGLHLGDLIVEGEDLYGDGVNVAARLESEAPAGGIVISGNVYDAVVGRLKAAFENMGDLALKNIERPVRAYRVQVEGVAASSATVTSSPSGSAPLALPDKPSIAVLPFQNMSGDPEQEYFVDGLVEDIITALSRFKSLFVIARNSSFTYKGKAVDIRQVGKELGVRFVLEGSVRKSGNKLRITGQLIESETGAHLWADRFDGSLEDVFELQDRVSNNVVAATTPALLAAEMRRSFTRPTRDLSAYDLYLQAVGQYNRGGRERWLAALKLFDEVIKRDSDYALSMSASAHCYMLLDPFLAPAERADNRERGAERARSALAAQSTDPMVLGMAAGVLAYFGEDIGTCIELINEALRECPGAANLWRWGGWINVFAGETDIAIEHFEKALRLSPRDPWTGTSLVGIGLSHLLMNRFEAASSKMQSGLEQSPFFTWGYPMLAACLGHLGQTTAAQRAIARLGSIAPNSDASNFSYLRKPDHRELMLAGLRLAGLPE
jgi:TolB-like protein/class 3 adenylate cyclase